jgi:glycosyltransferase involved in cell wall biosynthesis
MLTSRYTVCLTAWNEERRIRQAVSEFMGICPILVIDNASTDKTVEICNDMGIPVAVVPNPGFVECDEVMLKVQALVNTEYILLASLSEILPFQLLKAYADIAEQGEVDIVRARRISYTNGAIVPLTGSPRQHPGEQRFFRKGAVIFTGNQVHQRGMPKPDAKIHVLPPESELCIHHFRDYDASKSEDAHRRYNDTLARQRYETGQRFNIFKAVIWSAAKFSNAYLRYGCYRFGMLGFLHCVYRGWMEFSIWLRIWEWQSGNDIEHVRERNKAVRDKLRAELQAEKREIGLNVERYT